MSRNTLLLALLLALPRAARAADAAPAVPTPGEAGKKALSVVAAHLKDADPEIRAEAAHVLGLAGNPAALGVLRRMLRDPNNYVRIAAARAMWELGSTEGLKPLYAIINTPPAGQASKSPLDELKKISMNKAREKGVETLAEMKREKAAETLERLKDDDSGIVRDAAARELARLGRTEELEQFVDALGSEDEAMRYEGAAALGRICAPGGAARVAKLLEEEKSVRVRSAAVEALGCAPDKESASALLLKLAGDENPTIRFRAVSGLAGLRAEAVRGRLAAIAGETADIRLKIAAYKGIMLAGGKGDIAVPERGAEAVSPEVRTEALELLRSFPESEALPLLARALDDENVRVELAAALQIITRFSRK